MPKSAFAILFPLLLAIPGRSPAGPEVAPVPGPGAVIEAIEGFLKAADAGDRISLERAFAPMHRDEGIDYATDPATGKLEMRPAPRSDGGKVVFQEVAADGTHVAAEATAGALAAMLEKVGGKDRELSHRIVSVHADCPSAGCSWGSVELERTWRRDGQRMRVPMRATVLVRYQQEAPHMRIFLWHASRTGPEQLLKGAAKGD